MTPAPDHFLRRAHRRKRLGPLLLALAFAAFATALPLASTLGWIPAQHWTSAIGPWACLVASLTAFAFWLRRLGRLDASAHARHLDTELGLAARLEASAELARDTSAFAAAQRADAARHLASRPAPPATGWFTTLAALIIAASLLLVQLGLLGLRALSPAPDIAFPAQLPPDIAASLVWKSPESELKATAIEEIPLAAFAATRTGFRSLSLEVAVNGEPRLSRPLGEAEIGRLHQAGQHKLELELYLDEVGAQEFDLVSYHLRGDRATSVPAPVVASPLQFVQIRPAREDVERVTPPPGGGGGQPIGLLATMLGNLKAAQLQILKQNFLLAHAPIDRNSDVWREENARVAADQKLLAEKVAEAREFAIAESLPTLAVDILGQCIPLMEHAATCMGGGENEIAAKPQGQALGLIVSAEKLIRKILLESQGSASANSTPLPPNHDPFRDKQQFKLPPRAATPAGQLEQLAQAQADAAQPPAEQSQSDPIAEQAKLAERLAALNAAKSLDPAARPKAEQAAQDAAQAARQLSQGDAEAARAPAASSAAALRDAVAAQEAAAQAAAQAELEQIRRDINAAERLADPEERAAALATAAARLRAEALRQQETGSAEIARQLAETATKVESAARAPNPDMPGSRSVGTKPSPQETLTTQTPGQGEGEGPGSGPKSDPKPAPSPGPRQTATIPDPDGQQSARVPSPDGESPSATPGSTPGATPSPSGESAPSASQAAAQTQAALMSRDQALARAARQLARAAGESGMTLADLELAAQLAEALLPGTGGRERARQLADDTRREDHPFNNVVVIPKNLRDAAAHLVVLLQAARQDIRRDEQVRRFNPDDLDPAYRPAIEAYFEKLSRDAR